MESREEINEIKASISNLSTQFEHLVSTVDKLANSMENIASIMADQKVLTERMNHISLRVDQNQKNVEKLIDVLFDKMNQCDKNQRRDIKEYVEVLIKEERNQIENNSKWINRGIIGFIVLLLTIVGLTIPAYLKQPTDNRQYYITNQKTDKQIP